MRFQTTAIMMCTGLLAAGCASKQPKEDLGPKSDPALVAIAASAHDIQESWNTLGAVERSQNPAYIRYADDFQGDLPIGLDRKINLEWSGPLSSLVERMARDANYQYQVIGTAPPTPILVYVRGKGVAIGDVLRDAGYQAGSRAGVVIRGNRVELQYVSR